MCRQSVCFIFSFDISEAAQKNPPPPCSGLVPVPHDTQEQEQQAPHPAPPQQAETSQGHPGLNLS